MSSRPYGRGRFPRTTEWPGAPIKSGAHVKLARLKPSVSAATLRSGDRGLERRPPETARRRGASHPETSPRIELSLRAPERDQHARPLSGPTFDKVGLMAHARALDVEARGERVFDPKHHRVQLAELRASLRAQLDRADPMDVLEASRRWTLAVDGLMADLDAQVRTELGPPPPNPKTGEPLAYAFFATGSYGRMELSPYSDIDYGILIEADTPEIRSYFRSAAIRLRDLLERVDGEHGLRACREMSPSGYLGSAFVGTPDDLARRLAGATEDMPLRPLRDRSYIATGLGSARPFFGWSGGARLYDRFVRLANEQLGPAAPHVDESSERWRQVKELIPQMREPFGLPETMKDWLTVPEGGADLVKGAFWRTGAAPHVPRSPEDSLAEGRVNVKHDLLRCFQLPIQALRLLYAIDAHESGAVFDALVERGVLDPSFAGRLRSSLAEVQRMRLTNQLQAGRAEDKLTTLDDTTVRRIRRIVAVLLRFRQEMRRLGSEDPNGFALT